MSRLSTGGEVHEPAHPDFLATAALRRQLAETRDARLYRRTLAVLEFDHGRSAADIARMLGVTRQSVYDWVEAYTQDYDPASESG